MDLETLITALSTRCAVGRIAWMRNRRLMEAVKQIARPSAFATGRAPTALAAFIKRPQAVRFKSALPLQ
jgi:precorrin isomerase